MKTVWKIYDNYREKMLDGKYETEKEAENCLETIINEKEAKDEPYDFDIVEAEYIVKHEDIYNLQCDIDRYEYYSGKTDFEKILEYASRIVSHVKEMMAAE